MHSPNPEAGREAVPGGAVDPGPLPHPHFFQAYENALPGAADRILTMAEGLHRSRIRCEASAQWMAFLMVVIGLVGGLALVYLGKSLEGLAAIIVPIAFVGGMILAARHRRAGPSPQDPAGRDDTLPHGRS